MDIEHWASLQIPPIIWNPSLLWLLSKTINESRDVWKSVKEASDVLLDTPANEYVPAIPMYPSRGSRLKVIVSFEATSILKSLKAECTRLLAPVGLEEDSKYRWKSIERL